MTDIFLLTTVRPEIEKQALAKGFKTALLSLLLVSCSEFLLPLLEFDALGIWAWLLGGAATGLSLFPYQKLKRHKNNPDVLQANEKMLYLAKQPKCGLRCLGPDRIVLFSR